MNIGNKQSANHLMSPKAFLARRGIHGRAIVLVLLLLAGMQTSISSCVHSIEKDVKVTSSPGDDPEYSLALKKATQARTVFKDFETRYQVTATYLSPEFRAAFVKRLEKVYKKADLNLSEAAERAGFLVSIHSPEDGHTDLTNPHHWTVLMEGQKTALKPILVKKLSDKERWRAFFDSVNEWTTEYLIIFDTPSINANTPQLVDKSHVTLTFANADAQVNLTW